MKGLFLKDIQILKSFKKYIWMMFFIAIVIQSFSHSPFMIGYLTIISIMLLVNTMNFDEFNQGMSYLLTLPVSRKDYVKEKYIFGLILSGMFWFIALIINMIIFYVQGFAFDAMEFVLSNILVLFIEWLMLYVLIPVQIYYGQRKGNMAVVLVMGSVFVFGFGGMYLMDLLGIDVIAFLQSLSIISVYIFIIILSLVVGLIAYYSSIYLINKKEY